jgi:hypothetical protein
MNSRNPHVELNLSRNVSKRLQHGVWGDNMENIVVDGVLGSFKLP